MAFDKDNDPNTKVYAVEISRKEIESVPWTEEDQKFFDSCRKGPVSRKILGISILAKRIEDVDVMAGLRKQLNWKPQKEEEEEKKEEGG